ncbi:helix-turn-helix domain-containing protein [Pelagibacterium sp. 26DY04]|uniref:LexA family protein n=1 Tax=Pelagibacterium sp. 26DY04 TaxID=2967130 RepID=UPI0028161275|nr:S24 family peptidase [Pelagibacterium sp. 26DY04]WMT85599.1 helix-turn-helix domain-containing protein [Pelagibacterium sp. 26DY04]
MAIGNADLWPFVHGVGLELLAGIGRDSDCYRLRSARSLDDGFDLHKLTSVVANLLDFKSMIKGADFQTGNFFGHYDPDMQWFERLQARMDELGWSKAELSRRSGVPYDSVNKYLRGNIEQPRGDAIDRLAGAIGKTVLWLRDGIDAPDPVRQPDVEGFDRSATMRIPVRGEVAAGQWLETVPFLDDLQLEDWLDGLAVPEALKPFTYALRVKGSSINRLAPDGTYLVCLDITSGVEIHHRDVVVVERIRDQGALREVTAKRLLQRGDEIVLAPESDDPAWQTEIVLKDDPYQMDAEIRIVAKVKHVVRPL